MLVWKNASPEMLTESPPSSSSSRSAPASSSVSPPAVVSATLSSWVQSSPSAAGHRGRQRLLVELPARGHEPHLDLARAPPLAHDEVAQEALAGAAVVRLEALRRGTMPTTSSRAWLPFSEASRQSVTSTISSQRPGAWKPQISRPVCVPAERVLELVAVAPLLDRGDDRLEHVAVELADPPQRVVDLLLLDLELLRVGEHLPGGAGVVGDRLEPVGARA